MPIQMSEILKSKINEKQEEMSSKDLNAFMNGKKEVSAKPTETPQEKPPVTIDIVRYSKLRDGTDTTFTIKLGLSSAKELSEVLEVIEYSRENTVWDKVRKWVGGKK